MANNFETLARRVGELESSMSLHLHDGATSSRLASEDIETGWSDPTVATPTQHVMTVDGSWHEVDLSAEIPEGTTWVMLRVQTQSTTADTFTRFRSVGIDDTTTIHNTYSSGYTTVKVVQGVTGSKIEYKVDTAALQGWFYVQAYQ